MPSDAEFTTRKQWRVFEGKNDKRKLYFVPDEYMRQPPIYFIIVPYTPGFSAEDLTLIWTEYYAPGASWPYRTLNNNNNNNNSTKLGGEVES